MTDEPVEEIVALTPVQQFYSKAVVLLTGATGFFGRILLEKLLRSCPDLATIYILVRNKKGKNLTTRIDELFNDGIFDRLKNECPKYRHKVVGVGGDCGLPDLGLSQQDRQMLINEVNVVFHAAATVRFDEKLKLAVAINARGPQDLLKLAREMTNLRSFIHVSTAFSNVPYDVIEEKFYPSPVDSKKLILLAETMSDKVLDNLTPIILDKWPNTYTYTKAIAEDVVRQDSYDLPVGVCRPAIVVSTYREPVQAWINNLYGPTGVCAGAGSGLLRTLHADSRVNANIVPVDMCVNSIIVAACEVSEKFSKARQENQPYDIPIYHYESSNDKPINWGKFMSLSAAYGKTTPTSKAIWYYCFDLYSNFYVYMLATFLLHTLPAILVDGALLCMGKSPKMLKIYEKIHKFTKVISYFSTRTWIFKSQNVRRMIDKMSPEDREIFFCDLRELDWVKFFATYLLGIRVHLMQDPAETLPEAKIKWRRLYWLHQTVKVVAVIILVRLLWALVGTLLNYIS